MNCENKANSFYKITGWLCFFYVFFSMQFFKRENMNNS